jgi:transposase-like protein
MVERMEWESTTEYRFQQPQSPATVSSSSTITSSNRNNFIVENILIQQPDDKFLCRTCQKTFTMDSKLKYAAITHLLLSENDREAYHLFKAA